MQPPPFTTHGRPFEPKWGVPFNFDDDLQSDPSGVGDWQPYDLTGLTPVFQVFTTDFALEFEGTGSFRTGDPATGKLRFAASGAQMELEANPDGTIERRLGQWVLKDSLGRIVDVVPRGNDYREVIVGRMPE